MRPKRTCKKILRYEQGNLNGKDEAGDAIWMRAISEEPESEPINIT